MRSIVQELARLETRCSQRKQKSLPFGCLARGVRYRINRRPSRRPLSKRWRMINRARSRTRARDEHAFRIVKQLWGSPK